MSNDNDPIVRSTAADARAWAGSAEAQQELARLEALGADDIDFSDIPEVGNSSLVERVTSALCKADDDDVLAVVASAAEILRARRAGKAG